MEYLGDANAHSASDVISFVREVVEQNPNNSRADILAKLTQSLPQIRAARVFRAALWILGQYAEQPAQVDQSFTAIKDVLGESPFIPAEAEGENKENAAATPTTAANNSKPHAHAHHEPAGKGGSKTTTPARKHQLLLPDGSYASQTAMSELALQQSTGMQILRAFAQINPFPHTHASIAFAYVELQAKTAPRR